MTRVEVDGGVRRPRTASLPSTSTLGVKVDVDVRLRFAVKHNVAGKVEILEVERPDRRCPGYPNVFWSTLSAAAPLDCPITVFGGQDDALIPPADLDGWRAQTTARFALHIVPGDHFFVTTNRPPLFEALAGELRQEPGGARGAVSGRARA